MSIAVDPTLRDARVGDAAAIAEIDAERAGARKPAYWDRIVREYGRGAEGRVALVAEGPDAEVEGFLFGEVRAWEFGSERCGWIFSVSVRRAAERRGIASRLCDVAVRRFGELGVGIVRTMVRRNDVPMLALFRSLGFRAGPFSELEMRVPREVRTEGGSS